MSYQIHAVKPRLIVVAVRINTYLDIDRVVVIDSGHQRRTVLLADSPCSVCMVECLVDCYIINVIMDRGRQVVIVVCPGMSCRACALLEISGLVDHDVLWVILTCIAIDLFDLFCDRYHSYPP